MSLPKEPDPAKLVISLLMNEKAILQGILTRLEDHFGPLDLISPWLNFDYTDYYTREMGSPLFRRVIAFRPLIRQEDLATVKEITNGFEKLWETGGRRALNIDPGYLLLSRFILATGKDYSHRIYIGKRIYADLTLMYKKGGYQGFEWTYPDYKSDDMAAFLGKIRTKYSLDLKKERKKLL